MSVICQYRWRPKARPYEGWSPWTDMEVVINVMDVLTLKAYLISCGWGTSLRLAPRTEVVIGEFGWEETNTVFVCDCLGRWTDYEFRFVEAEPKRKRKPKDRMELIWNR